MWEWFVGVFIKALLDWLSSWLLKKGQEEADTAADQQKNHDIEQAVENAKTEQEEQDALNQAAGRLGRNP